MSGVSKGIGAKEWCLEEERYKKWEGADYIVKAQLLPGRAGVTQEGFQASDG